MNSKYIRLLMVALLFASCKSEFSSFNEKAINSIKDDNHLDQKEYSILKEIIKNAEDKGFQQFKDDTDQIEDDKVVAYLLKYFKAKQIATKETYIWQPNKTSVSIKKFNINVYIENSQSMDGYVRGRTDFESTIYDLLGNFKISGICDSLNLGYINQNIKYQNKNATASDIQNFVEKLDPATFKKSGGDKSSSDLKDILNKVLKTVDDRNAIVLISDFVFSPGRNANAQEYLNSQSVGIKIDFAQKLAAFDLSVVIVQLQSDFNGFYYDKTDKPTYVINSRPYYLWILGSKQQIKSVIDSKILDHMKGGYLNRLALQSVKTTNQPNYKILYSPKTGNFDARDLSKKIISNASSSKNTRDKGLFGFNIAVDFSNNLQDSKYFSEASNYKITNSKYSLKAEPIIDANNASLSGFTHVLKLQTTELRDEVLQIDIPGKIPSWAFKSTSTDDTHILKDSGELQKTFGFKYLIEGLYDAFYPKSTTKPTASINVTIKK